MGKEKSVGAALFRKQGNSKEFLLMHYIAGHWGLPKGHIEPGETEKQTLAREIKEETSLEKVEILPGFRIPTKYFFRRGKETIFKEVIFYLVEAKSGKVFLSHEHQGFAWLPFEKAVEKLSFKNTKQVLAEAEKFQKQ